MNLQENEEQKIERLKKSGKSDAEITKILKQDREKLARIKEPYIALYGEDGPEIDGFLNMFKGRSNAVKLEAMNRYVEEAGDIGDRVPLLDWMDDYLMKLDTVVESDEVESAPEAPKIFETTTSEVIKGNTDKHRNIEPPKSNKAVEVCAIRAKAYVKPSEVSDAFIPNKVVEVRRPSIIAKAIKR